MTWICEGGYTASAEDILLLRKILVVLGSSRVDEQL